MSGRSPGPPPVIPGFSYIRHLGSGGFADVFLFKELWFDRLVAIKVLSGQLSEETTRQFTDEANLMARLANHPSIVTVYRAGISDDARPYLVMEYCSQPNLDTRYRTTRFTEAETLTIGIEIAGAVETVHRAGILHRDIKPANILTTDYHRHALTDFGIAATIGTGAQGMSVPWSPPESFTPNAASDERRDIYSLAATLYTLLAGHTPFETPGQPNTTTDLIHRIQHTTITPINRADLSTPLQNVLTKAMAKDPTDRYTTASQLARALQRVQVDLAPPQTRLEVQDTHHPSHEIDGNTHIHQPGTHQGPTHATTARPGDVAGAIPAALTQATPANTILKPPTTPTPAPSQRRLTAVIITTAAAIIAALSAAIIWGPWSQPTASEPRADGPATTTTPAVEASPPSIPSPSPAPSRAASKVVVNENFSRPELPAGWTPAEGTWRVVDEHLESTTDDTRARIQFGPMSPENFRLDATVRFVQVANDSRWLNIGLDYHVAKDWGAVLVVRSNTAAKNGLELAQRKRYAAKFVSKPVRSSPTSVDVGEKHLLTVVVRGRTLDVSIDGEHVFGATNMVRTGGQLGFVINNSTVQFDNVKVVELYE